MREVLLDIGGPGGRIFVNRGKEISKRHHHGLRQFQISLDPRAKRIGRSLARRDLPLKKAAPGGVVGLFLEQEEATEASKGCPALDEAGFDSLQDGFAEPFENDLLGQDRFGEVPSAERFINERPVSFQGGQKGARPQVAGRQPRDRRLKDHGMRRFLPGLSGKKPAQGRIRRQFGLCPRAIMGQALALLQEPQQSRNRHSLAGQHYHDGKE